MRTSVAGAVVPRTQLQSDLYSFLMRSDVSALIQDMLTSVAGAVVPRTQLQSDLYSFLMRSDVSALIQDMLTSVAGGVVPLTQLQSDLYSFLMRSDVSALIQDMLTSVAGAVAAYATAVRPLLLLGGHRRDGPGSGRRHPYLDPVQFGRRRRCWAVASGGCVSGVAVAAGPAICRYPGRAVGRQRTVIAPLGGIGVSIFAAMSQVCEALSLPGRAQLFFRPASSELLLIGSLAGLAAVALPGTAGTARLIALNAAGVLPLSGGAGRSCSPRCRESNPLYPDRRARRIPPGHNRFRVADIGHRALRPSGGRLVRCGSFGLIGCRLCEGIAVLRSGAVPSGVVGSGSLVVVRRGLCATCVWAR